MRAIPKTVASLSVLLGCGAASCMIASDGGADRAGPAETPAVETEPFNAGPAPAGQIRGHEEIMKKAILYLAQHNLLPTPLLTPANQSYLIYGDNFADHPWLGRPESPKTPVPNRMTAYTPSSGRVFGAPADGNFQFDISGPWYWDDPTVTTTAHSAVNWMLGAANTDQPNTALHFQSTLSIRVDVFLSTIIDFFTDSGDGTRWAPPLDFAVDNLAHYAMGDVRDFGVTGLPADAGNLKLYPFYPEHAANDINEWNGWDGTHKDLGNKLSANMVNQPIVTGMDFGVDKYGAILYQLARKFFAGSPAEPSLSELVKAGNSVTGWHTGTLQGIGGLNEMYLTFPHTYLGGNPNVCSGSSTADPCAAGQPTWPVWVPATTPTLAMMEVQKPGRSDRDALIYLGWASHMMQDGSAPHHAANWTGKEHQAQDDFGDVPYFYTLTPGYESYFVDYLIASEADALLGSRSAPKTRASICSSLGVTDGQIYAGSLNYGAVRPLFLQNAKNAFLSKHEGTITSIAHTDYATIADGAQMVKNAILGTMKLLLCAPPSSVTTGGYQNTTFASGFVWAQSATGSYTANSNYSYNSSASNPANTVTQLATGYYRVDFPGVGAETGGNVQVTAYSGGSERCKVGGWWNSANTLSTTVYCHNAAGAPVNTQFTASYVRRAGVNSGTGGYLWADQPTASSYTPSVYYQYNATGALNTIQRNGVGQYVATFPGVSLAGGSVEVTAYGSGSEYCKVVGWGSNAVWVNCFANGGVPADTLFTLNFSDQSPLGTPSYQYAWADQPTASSYTPSTYYQKGYLARECGSDAGTVTIQRIGQGAYLANLPVLSPTGSNVKVTAYGSGSETCKVVGWWGNGSSGTTVDIACYDAAGQPVDTLYDLVYASSQWIIC